MYNNVPPQLWMQLDVDTRFHLKKIFDIPRTGITEIIDQRVITDGHSTEDLRVITLEKMNEYNGSKYDSFPHAWEVTCSKAKYELNPPLVEMKSEPIIETKPQNNGTKKSK